jgi:hypothetical protein
MNKAKRFWLNIVGWSLVVIPAFIYLEANHPIVHQALKSLGMLLAGWFALRWCYEHFDDQ